MPPPVCSQGEQVSRKQVLLIAAALLLSGALLYLYSGHQAPPGQPALAELTPENADSIRNAFNAAKGEVRLLLLLSPT